MIQTLRNLFRAKRFHKLQKRANEEQLCKFHETLANEIREERRRQVK
ncbi:hypothetical protein HWB90_gp066 [Mycobacterium phage Fowlmouth]|uniref:Uncharacterized protein n=1 Tax=Mycobacterium phage Fowlmouth TaxID=2419978 RepID=A0A3G2KGA7_9CAUD|nr:hypothetical protein HWB90_gp066 [Mycobacterium phage Fowlmouth]AYN58016.1 hypothetical protein SEA_FOWLMOUTH_66 [Mycobacterium phage Fowlmouth]